MQSLTKVIWLWCPKIIWYIYTWLKQQTEIPDLEESKWLKSKWSIATPLRLLMTSMYAFQNSKKSGARRKGKKCRESTAPSSEKFCSLCAWAPITLGESKLHFVSVFRQGKYKFSADQHTSKALYLDVPSNQYSLHQSAHRHLKKRNSKLHFWASERRYETPAAQIRG